MTPRFGTLLIVLLILHVLFPAFWQTSVLALLFLIWRAVEELREDIRRSR